MYLYKYNKKNWDFTPNCLTTDRRVPQQPPARLFLLKYFHL